MKLERATLALRPRTLGQCLDLALVMLRAHGATLIKLWAIVAVPACLVVYCGVLYGDFTLRLAVVAFWLATIPMEMLLVAAAAPSAFGETPSVRGTFRRLGLRDGILLFIKLVVFRVLAQIAGLLLVFPGIWVLARTGFTTEQTVLSRLDNRLYDHRTSELFKGEMLDLMLRGAVIAGYCFLLFVVLFITCDFIGTTLSFPILFGRMARGIDSDFYTRDGLWDAVWLFLTADPVAVTALLLVALAVFPVGRLAWLLCYIDLRVRRDCWDMEVAILNEARRLEES